MRNQETAKGTGTSIEINAYPLRHDLNKIYVRKAKKMGVSFAINTDAHVNYQFDFMNFGAGMARRGWLEKGDVINTCTYDMLMKLINLKRTVEPQR